MSTFNWITLAIGLLLAAGWFVPRVNPLDAEKIIGFAWLLPIVALLLPPVLLLVSLTMKAANSPEFVMDVFRIAFFLSCLAAPVVGFQTLSVLSTQSNLGKDGWRQRKVRYAGIFACLGVISPVLYIVGFLFLLMLKRTILG